jgi:hypothetical protein
MIGSFTRCPFPRCVLAPLRDTLVDIEVQYSVSPPFEQRQSFVESGLDPFSAARITKELRS